METSLDNFSDRAIRSTLQGTNEPGCHSWLQTNLSISTRVVQFPLIRPLSNVIDRSIESLTKGWSSSGKSNDNLL